ncbi:unnamed protein product, partial [marine sediment metagenome]
NVTYTSFRNRFMERLDFHALSFLANAFTDANS